MKAKVMLVRANGYGCSALIVNNVVVAEANTTVAIDRLVHTAAHQLRAALKVPLVECTVDVPPEMDGTWEWTDLVPLLPGPTEEPEPIATDSPTLTRFFELLNTAKAVRIDDGPWFKDWAIANPTGNPDNEVVIFSWKSEGISHTDAFTEGAIHEADFIEGSDVFILDNREGDPTVIAFNG